MGTGLRRCDGVAARSPTASLGSETPGGSPPVTPIARHYTSAELVCSGRVAVGLHRRIALFPGPGRAVREIGDCSVPTILYNQRGSPWPDLARGPSAHGLDPWASTSSVGKLSLPQVVDARDEPGQGAFGSKIRCKTPARTALQFSPDIRAGFRRGDDDILECIGSFRIRLLIGEGYARTCSGVMKRARRRRLVKCVASTWRGSGDLGRRRGVLAPCLANDTTQGVEKGTVIVRLPGEGRDPL